MINFVDFAKINRQKSQFSVLFQAFYVRYSAQHAIFHCTFILYKPLSDLYIVL